MSVKPRMNRLFAQNGKCVTVALDHGIANEPSLLPCMENMQKLVHAIVAAKPDAILLTFGQAHWLQDMPKNPKPALALRVDPTNFYTIPTATHVFSKLHHEAVETAVALDAATIVVNLLWAPDQPELYGQCVDNVIRLKPQCERFGLPMMVEPLVMAPDGKGGYKLNSDIEKTVALARVAVELGADIVKADIAENLTDYHRVVEVSLPRPLLPRGGPKVSDQQVLERTYTLIKEGASGVVYGKNIYQHPHPNRMVRACQAIVHEGATVAQAKEILEGKE